MFWFLSLGDGWDGISSGVSGWETGISVTKMAVSTISVSAKSITSPSSITDSWGSSDGWGSSGLNVDIGCSRDFGMDVWLSWDFDMDIGFSGDFLMDIRFSGNFLVDVRYGSWVNLSGIIVWVDECWSKCSMS